MSIHSSDLRGELLDDFYAECDELFTSARAALVSIERHLGEARVVQPQLELLFRNVHSIKGNSAIVGLRLAEELAHDMEDLLRGTAKGGLALTAPMVDVLLIATQRLEQIVAAHRLGKPAPETAAVLTQLRSFTSKSSPAAVPAPSPPTSALETAAVSVEDAARARGLHLWQGSFAPSPELDQRGVNITAIRKRLGEIGEILKATPSVRGKGIVFDFLLGVRDEPADLAAWARDGLHLQALPVLPVPSDAGALETPAVSPAAFPSPLPDTAEALSLTPSHIVRVDLARLDDLMRILGEMVIHRSRLEDRIAQVPGAAGVLKEINIALARSLRDMREALSRVRLVPIAEIFTRIPFVVRELTRDSDKKARVLLEGHQTVVDKYLVERLKEPLLHLVRNSFAHGIEPAANRLAAGKPAEATILLRAMSVGDSVLIQIRDDGRGIDAAAVAARARSLGLPVPDRLDGEGLLRVLCLPGFSTRDEADLAAGRGVGMAVVANTVRELGGRLALETTPGVGTEFSLRLPLTLSIVDAVIATVGDQLCAVPQNALDEIIQVSAQAARTIKQTEVIPYRDGLLPFVRLRTIFGLGATPRETLTVMVLRGERGATGLVIDGLRGQREIVVRPLVDPLLRAPGIAGATELGDGRPVLILDPVAITNDVVRPPSPDLSTASASHRP